MWMVLILMISNYENSYAISKRERDQITPLLFSSQHTNKIDLIDCHVFFYKNQKFEVESKYHWIIFIFLVVRSSSVSTPSPLVTICHQFGANPPPLAWWRHFWIGPMFLFLEFLFLISLFNELICLIFLDWLFSFTCLIPFLILIHSCLIPSLFDSHSVWYVLFHYNKMHKVCETENVHYQGWGWVGGMMIICGGG